MILDRLDNWMLYAEPGSRLAAAFHYLMLHFDPDTPDGREDLEGELLYAMIQGYRTRAPRDCRFEAHREYIDIQYVFEGAEGMGWAPVDELDVDEEYDPQGDVGFFRTPVNSTTIAVRPGWFALFHPSDAHAPGIRLPESESVRKVVVKVHIDHLEA